MAERRSNKAGWITTLIVACILGGAALTSVLLRWLGDWKEHAWGLSLAERIVWGCCLVAALANVLTRVTIFGWNFRRYFRWPQEGGGQPAPPPGVLPRPARAPWGKSGAASFSITVVLVSLTGATAVALTVLWILWDVLGDWVFWLVFKIIAASWWVLCIVTVLVRLAVFRWQMKRDAPARPGPQPEGDTPGPDAPGPPGVGGPRAPDNVTGVKGNTST
jgi:hypothetical protein